MSADPEAEMIEIQAMVVVDREQTVKGIMAGIYYSRPVNWLINDWKNFQTKDYQKLMKGYIANRVINLFITKKPTSEDILVCYPCMLYQCFFPFLCFNLLGIASKSIEHDLSEMNTIIVQSANKAVIGS